MAPRRALAGLAFALLGACAAAAPPSPGERAQPHFQAGVLAAEGGELDRAMSHFSRAIEENPGYADAYFRRGSSRLKRVLRSEIAAEAPELERAVEDLSEALRIFPLHYEAAYNRGLALAALSRYREAAQDFRHVLQTREVQLQRDAHARLGELFEEKFVEMEAQARAHYEKYAELGGRDQAVLDRLSALKQRGEKGKERLATEREAETLLFEAVRLAEARKKVEASPLLERAIASGGLSSEKKGFAASLLAQWRAEGEAEAAAAKLLKEAQDLIQEGKSDLAIQLLTHASKKYGRTRVVVEEIVPLLKGLTEKRDK